jgi:hypothetical protein
MGHGEGRQAVIDSVDAWAEDNGVSVTLLGTDEDRADYAPAITGVADLPRPAVVYSIGKLIRCFMKSNGWTEEEAWDWYSYNTERGAEYLRPDDNPPQLVWEIDDIM